MHLYLMSKPVKTGILIKPIGLIREAVCNVKCMKSTGGEKNHLFHH